MVGAKKEDIIISVEKRQESALQLFDFYCIIDPYSLLPQEAKRQSEH